MVQNSRRVHFGLFDVDLCSGEIRKGGLKLRLAGQPFQVLAILLENPGQVVTREELQKRIWPDTFVDFQHNLNAAINRIREVLGDSAENPLFLETLPRRGYRFVAPVRITNSPCGADQGSSVAVETSEQKALQNRRPITALLAGVGTLLLLFTLAFAGDKLRDRVTAKAAPSIRSLAVLPLQNLSNDPSQEYFADGMTDALITDLAQVGSLKVISRTTTAHYRKTTKTTPDIARELKVDGVVEGAVQRSGDHVRITVQLIDGPADRHIWANSYDRDLRDVLLLEQEVASAIAREIRAQVAPQVRTRFEQKRPVNPEAMEAYLQGRYHLDRIGQGRGYDDYKAAIENFQLAVRRDPNFATAYVWLGDAYEESFGSPPSEMMPLQKAAEEKAISLDPQLAQAHVKLGTYHLYYDWDWPASEKELLQAIELEPSSAAAREAWATYLAVMGRFDEAIQEHERAQELDPADEHMAQTYLWFRQYDRAIEAERAYLAFHPQAGFSHWSLYEIYALKGMERESIEELELTWKLFGFEDVPPAIHRAYIDGGFAAAMQESGHQMALLHDRRIVALPTEAAKYYAFAGDNERALKWLQTALEERDGALTWLNREQVWDPLRDDPRFRAIVRRVGLPR
jgi:TolB-like protein/DNA-binding winged helix-turn-helix (wHTH) protein